MPAVSDVIIRVEVRGISQVVQKLRALKATIGKNIVRRGFHVGAIIVRDEARRRVPVRYGGLKKSIVAITSIPPGARGDQQVVSKVTIARRKFYIGPDQRGRLKRKSIAYSTKAHGGAGIGLIRGYEIPKLYAHLVHEGTRPHYQPRRGVMHPGARPNRFLSDAWDAKQTDATEAIANRIWSGVEEALKR